MGWCCYDVMFRIHLAHGILLVQLLSEDEVIDNESTLIFWLVASCNCS